MQPRRQMVEARRASANGKCQGDCGNCKAYCRCCLPALAGFVSPHSTGPGRTNCGGMAGAWQARSWVCEIWTVGTRRVGLAWKKFLGFTRVDDVGFCWVFRRFCVRKTVRLKGEIRGAERGNPAAKWDEWDEVRAHGEAGCIRMGAAMAWRSCGWAAFTGPA